MKKIIVSTIAACILLLGQSGCKLFNTEPANPTVTRLETGPSVVDAIQAVGSAGGSVRIDTGALAGLVITVKNGPGGPPQTIRISHAPITAHTFGELFNPISPLIRISSGGELSDSGTFVRIPCTVTPGRFAMAFAYDRATGELDATTMLESDGSHVTFVTGTFDHFTGIARQSGLPSIQEEDGTDYVVTEIDETKLTAGADSKFKPGVDDWQFTNYGSYEAPDGLCDGQSASAMWYFNTQRLGANAPQLYGRFDNDGVRKTPKIWADDALGYKFASMVHTDGHWGTRVISNVLNLFGQSIPIISDVITRNSIVYAIRLTDRPVLLGIYASFMKDGHAIIAYKATNNVICVADPNFPGVTTRQFSYDGRVFGTYRSSDRAGQPGTDYIHYYMISARSFIQWTSIETRWKQLLDGTIGNGRFPDFTVRVLNKDDEFVPLKDGDTLASPFSFSIPPDGKRLRCYQVYSEGQVPLGSTGPINLPKGNQLVGFAIFSDNDTVWAGFRWYRVTITESETDSNVIMPLALGNEWNSTVLRYDSNGVRTSQYLDTLRIESTDMKVDEKWYEAFENGVEDYTYANRPDGLYVTNRFTPPTLYLKYPAVAQDTFGTIRFGNLISNFLVGSTDTLIVSQWGTEFHCYMYVQQIRDTLGRLLSQQQLNALYRSGDIDATHEYKYWAPRVGPVKDDACRPTQLGVEYVFASKRLDNWHFK